MSRVEQYYGKAFRSVLKVINPIKKQIITTECKVHRFINYQSIKLLGRYEYIKEFEFYTEHMLHLNEGAVWADQDFKSSSHFYHPYDRKGLYGQKNAMDVAENYYQKAVNYWKKDNLKKSLFYLGACVHILQDLTIPQHVNVKLLDNHRQYENFVKLTYDIVKDFRTDKKPIHFSELKYYGRFNAKRALKYHAKYRKIANDRSRFYKITLCSLPLAQRTTAGCLLMFLKDVDFYKNRRMKATHHESK